MRTEDYYDYDDDYLDYLAHRSIVNSLKARACLHPMDPDALDEEEQEYLERMENWEP